MAGKLILAVGWELSQAISKWRKMGFSMWLLGLPHSMAAGFQKGECRSSQTCQGNALQWHSIISAPIQEEIEKQSSPLSLGRNKEWELSIFDVP